MPLKGCFLRLLQGDNGISTNYQQVTIHSTTDGLLFFKHLDYMKILGASKYGRREGITTPVSWMKTACSFFKYDFQVLCLPKEAKLTQMF